MWEPILDGDLAERAVARVREISGIAPPDVTAEDATLLWAYAAPGSEPFTAAKAALIAKIARGYGGYQLHGGLTGAGWILAHVHGDEDVLRGIDDRLLAALSTDHWSGDLDLSMGLAGIGVYFLERLPAARAQTGIAKVVEHLERAARITDLGIAWPRPTSRRSQASLEQSPGDLYDCGAANGVAGIVAVLGRITAVGGLAPSAAMLCDGG